MENTDNALHYKELLSQYKKDLYRIREKRGLCVRCGGINDTKTKRCEKCRLRHNKTMAERRSKLAAGKIDTLIDKGLITTREAANILGITTRTVTKYIKQNKLKVMAIKSISGGTAFWVSESDVIKLKNDTLMPNMRCLKCGHHWISKSDYPTMCPAVNCRSNNIERYKAPKNAVLTSIKKIISSPRLSLPMIEGLIEKREQGYTVRSICQEYNICLKTFYKYWHTKDRYVTTSK